MATLKTITGQIKKFEEEMRNRSASEVETRIKESETVKKLVAFGKDVYYALGQYLHEKDSFEANKALTPSLERAWILLFQMLMRTYNLSANLTISSSFLDYKNEFTDKYLVALQDFECRKAMALKSENAFSHGSMKIQDNIDISVVILNFTYLLTKAEELFRSDEVKRCNKRIRYFTIGV